MTLRLIYSATLQGRSDGSYVAIPNEDSDTVEASVGSASSQPLLTSRKIPRGGSLALHSDGHGYTYAYGPKGLTGLLHNHYALSCAIFVSIGGLLFGYDQGVIANVLVMKDFMTRWPIGAWEKGVMSTWCLIDGYRIEVKSRHSGVFLWGSCRAGIGLAVWCTFVWHSRRSILEAGIDHKCLRYAMTTFSSENPDCENDSP